MAKKVAKTKKSVLNWKKFSEEYPGKDELIYVWLNSGAILAQCINDSIIRTVDGTLRNARALVYWISEADFPKP